MMTDEEKPKRARGFALMDPERRRELAREGGRAAHRGGRAHRFTTEEAKIAGRKGGAGTHRARRAPSGNGS